MTQDNHVLRKFNSEKYARFRTQCPENISIRFKIYQNMNHLHFPSGNNADDAPNLRGISFFFQAASIRTRRTTWKRSCTSVNQPDHKSQRRHSSNLFADTERVIWLLIRSWLRDFRPMYWFCERRSSNMFWPPRWWEIWSNARYGSIMNFDGKYWVESTHARCKHQMI